MAVKTYERKSRAVIRDKRWPALRHAAKQRDGWQCVKCGFRGRLEVDHIKPVRSHPELSFELDNLQSLCRFCHSRKTQIEVGFRTELDPKRAQWRALVRQLAKPQTSEVSKC